MADTPFTPYTHVTGILEDPSRVDAVRQAMASIDVAELQFIDDASDITDIDPDGSEHGLLGRIVRTLQRFGEEGVEHRAAVEALEEGKLLVGVETEEEHRELVAQALRSVGGVVRLRWWGHDVLEEL